MLTLYELLQHGQLGALKLGLTDTEVKELFGPPQDVSARNPPLLWKYGNVEIHFEQASETDNQLKVWLLGVYFWNESEPFFNGIHWEGWLPQYGTTESEFLQKLDEFEISYELNPALTWEGVRTYYAGKAKASVSIDLEDDEPVIEKIVLSVCKK